MKFSGKWFCNVFLAIILLLSCLSPTPNDLNLTTSQKYVKTFIDPTVAIILNNQIAGSGVIIDYQGEPTILTAKHIIVPAQVMLFEEAVGLEISAIHLSCQYKIGIWDGKALQYVQAYPFYIDKTYDFALLKIHPSAHPISRSGNLVWKMPTAILGKHEPFTPIVVVGFPRSSKMPRFTYGDIGIAAEGSKYIPFNAPIVYGNSGGPLFSKHDGSILGIVSRIQTIPSNGISVPIYHLGEAVSSAVISEALSSMNNGMEITYSFEEQKDEK